jgi:hypothetical protein
MLQPGELGCLPAKAAAEGERQSEVGAEISSKPMSRKHLSPPQRGIKEFHNLYLAMI